MSERFFQSPQPITISEDTPLIFLEGPVQGSPDWQTPFAHRLLEEFPTIAVASPRVTPEHEANLTSSDPEISARASERQVAYEFLARRLAFHYGAIALWYAAQDPSLPYRAERVYAKTTQIETGEAWGVLAYRPEMALAIGFDPAFKAGPRNSRNYIELNNRLLGLPTYTSLDDVYDDTADSIARIMAVGPQPIPSSAAQSMQRALDLLGSE